MSTPCSTICLRDSVHGTFVVVQCVPEVNNITYSVYEGNGNAENAGTQYITGTASSVNRPNVGPSFSFLAQKEPYLIVLNVVYASGETRVFHWNVDPSKRRLKKKVAVEGGESSASPENEPVDNDTKVIETEGGEVQAPAPKKKRGRAAPAPTPVA